MRANRHFLVFAACVCACGVVSAQYGEGPLPPRLQIPGAVPVSGGRPPQRNLVRQRRPQQLAPQARQQAYLPTPTNDAPTPPTPTRPAPPTTLPPRPVEEDPEEYDDEELEAQTPALPVTSAPAPPPVFRTNRPPIRQYDNPPQYRPAQPARPVQRTLVPINRGPVAEAPAPVTRQQVAFRPQPTRPTVFRPERPILAPEALPQVSEQRDYNRQPVQQRAEQQRVEQQQRPEQQALLRQPQQQRPEQQSLLRQQQQQRPQVQLPVAHAPRYKPQRANQKPVAQVLNRFREELPDGSISWGYENDDGSFKEETIGANCIVSGKYGYIDPDGMRREYTYSSGILCDKTKEAEQEDEGYMDYQNNAYVLPNGQSVDLQSFSKNKSRRPNYGK